MSRALGVKTPAFFSTHAGGGRAADEFPRRREAEDYAPVAVLGHIGVLVATPETGVTISPGDYEGREALCRYVLRHPLSLERLSFTQDGRVGYAVKYPRSPTRTHLLLEPLQLLARVASLIPPPRHPLVRYRGVLSSASRWRQHVVPKNKRAPLPSPVKKE